MRKRFLEGVGGKILDRRTGLSPVRIAVEDMTIADARRTMDLLLSALEREFEDEAITHTPLIDRTQLIKANGLHPRSSQD